ncbi:hypothetical protein F4813DRAFT_348844 [Daldinia decipiens]|uniref:uncharacterized protein n=1 Tax=Daldinia decipiens TaxID=326647 RepID=UPI0020C3D998|nr:uncharacterized protein F4813DRAFT_348844 [Daldinia decipiens]KAI1660943.1 hypothetical protein F4813DRAFT_348844 [Daldinia decipiens]
MRDALRDWRHSLRGRQTRAAKKRTPLDSSSQRPHPQPPGPSHEGKINPSQRTSRTKIRPRGSVNRLLDRLGSLTLGPNGSQPTIKTTTLVEDQPMPDAPDVPGPPPVPAPPHARPVYPIPSPPPIPAPSDNPVPPPVAQNELAPDQGWAGAMRPPGDPGFEAASRAVQVSENGFNQPQSGTEWAEVPKRKTDVTKQVEPGWFYQNAEGWGSDASRFKEYHSEGGKIINLEDEDDDDDDDDDDDENENEDEDEETDWGQGPTERWMENFAPNKFADRDYVGSNEPDDPEVCVRNSDEDIMTFGIGDTGFQS